MTTVLIVVYFVLAFTAFELFLADWFDRVRARRGHVPIIDPAWRRLRAAALWVEHGLRWCGWALVRLFDWMIDWPKRRR